MITSCPQIFSTRLTPAVEHRSRGYILHNSVTHARHLPVESTHAFTYPTLTFLVSLQALEDGQLDLGNGWIFGYGGLWGRLTGLRPEPYLTPGTGTIRQKLAGAMQAKGIDNLLLADAWMMTMPSFLGFEGINPLSVYFVYDMEGRFTHVVLEIHNTFGESHLHILQQGVKEDTAVDPGYDHQWTFEREFHVSPFNDRSGFYRISVKAPSHSPMQEDPVSPQYFPKPAVRVHLYTRTADNRDLLGDLKLRALLRPITATPLTSTSLILALLRAPFGLLLTMPRILFMAWKLHYQKRLDVFLRPDPLPASIDYTPDECTKITKKSSPAGGVKWLDEGPLERFARLRTETFLRQRAEETRIEVTLIPADPNFPKFKATPSGGSDSSLTISYLSSRFFVTLFTCPSAKHALLMGCDVEEIFSPSSRELFLEIFSSKAPAHRNSSTMLQRLRQKPIPSDVKLFVPDSHFLDGVGMIETALNLWVLLVEQFAGQLESWIFSLLKARVVRGTEPWTRWQRAALLLSNKDTISSMHDRNPTIGSVRRT
ncbi:hypothetical protein BJ165DRAFT_690511 [Panaeolus papilionaceus]|nr:hypothetical protein BJ165DRAFT_690511 [Panaeolus papilionaceus]